MKKIAVLLCFAVCFVLLCSCTVKNTNDDVITGDVIQDINQVENNENVDENIPVDETETDITFVSAEDIIKSLGGNSVLRGGDSAESAQAFCEAVVTGDGEKIAEFTNGDASYYEFLSEINVKYYSLYPFVLGENARKYAEENNLYIGGTDMYIAEFDVENADGECFKDGINYYYLEFSNSGYEFDESVSAFVPYNDAKNVMFGEINIDYTKRFISETISLMDDGENFKDGKNNADAISFNSPAGVHYITHLMARNPKYPDSPPYTMLEIEEFVKESFDGHKGLDINSVMSFQRWIYPMLEEEKTSYTKEDRAYGCNYAHGGTVCEYTITDVVNEDGMISAEVQLYADFSKFAKAKKLTFLFEEREDESVTLLGVVQSDNKQRPVAGMSF